MARPMDVEITLMDGTKAFIPQDVFNRGNIPEKPEAVIGNAVKGSGSPVFRVNTSADMNGEWEFVVAQNILKFKVTYK
ncbi:hypothetical protein KAMFAM_73 [Bacillus phage Kamfam]|uniref:Uncharacterized protein n=2 Tax=Bastillevirus TaxID=1918010 RepID=A0A024B0V2_9CAUD|nr:hypothetical protein FP76_gp072 [Bacillus phage Evoli]AHZ09796.1 hypothetical protein [Bacillus phage Evoli]ASR79591.1 hypothetical protein OTK52_71 [Bacillus phage OTooleKemple52]ASU00921.1 hypothetical protein ANTHONY_74 [Bacillus phage Anthony]AXQ67288.1 hypothetical protein KAMFAM_73 [Bacillus phage Kamfam]